MREEAKTQEDAKVRTVRGERQWLDEDDGLWYRRDSTFDSKRDRDDRVVELADSGYVAYWERVDKAFREDPYWKDAKRYCVYSSITAQRELTKPPPTEEEEEEVIVRDKVSIGTAGAHYVAFRLSALGYAVGLTTHGARAIDLFVANPATGKSITVQTKTMFKDAFVSWRGGGYCWKWQVGIKALHGPVHANFFWVFVDLKGNSSRTPDVFVVPSGKVRDLLNVWPEGVDPESGEVKVVWCNIQDKDAQNYKNNWDAIKHALA